MPISKFVIGREYKWEQALEMLSLPPSLKRAVVQFSGGRFALFLTGIHPKYTNWIRDAVLNMQIEPAATHTNDDLRGAAPKYLFFRDQLGSGGAAPFRYEGEVVYEEDLPGPDNRITFRVLDRQG
jgi:hypothetical protein